MAEIAQPGCVKLLCGMLSADPQWFAAARGRLEAAYGPVDLDGPVTGFDFTHYYDQTMGQPLVRTFVAFERTIDPGELPAVKRFTNSLEEQFAAESDASVMRPINLDPGYVTSAKLVLASMKDFAHRVYLTGGVYAEVTLQYRHGRWQSFPWTFPDYASGTYDAFLMAARDALRRHEKEDGR